MKFLTQQTLTDMTERTMNSFMLALASNDDTKMKQCQQLLNALALMDNRGDVHESN